MQANHAPQSAGADTPVHADVPDLRLFVFALFFIFGGITSLNDILIPKLKELFTLSYTEAMLVQSAFFFAYFVVSLPGAAIVRRLGYMKTAVVGLLTMTVGCLLFIPASQSGQFVVFLGALFVLAAGITIVQVVANPLISLLGQPRTTHSRLTFAQAFNSLGTTVFPYVGSILILGSLSQVDVSTLTGDALQAYRAQETHVVMQAYGALAVAIVLVAGLVWLRRDRLPPTPATDTPILQAFNLLRHPRFGYGALCIFLYVGGEVAIGSIIVNYLMAADVMGLGEQAAGKMVPLYWGGAMVGRFIGSYFLKIFSPGKVLATVCAVVIGLLLVSANTTGTTSGYALLAIGLCNSIMFPTIFSLACEGLGKRAAEGSGVICVAIVGGAVVPLLFGVAADVVGLKLALVVPALCYIGILGFGWYARRPYDA
jgi:FHS family L-fucose permease-like MFS transporter